MLDVGVSGSDRVDVSVIIVNYNTEDLTMACVDSVLKQTSDINYEIIVVDNASPDGPPLSIDANPKVQLIKSAENGGFAKGNNIGITNAKGRYILLLNSDTELLNDALAISMKLMDQNKDWGILGGQLVNPGNRIQHSARRFRSILWEILELVPLYLFLPKRKKEELMLHHYFDHSRHVEADWISGAFMFIRKEVIDSFPQNKLPEDYFMYCEDVLWCWMAKTKGWKVVFNPEPKIFHHHHGSVNKEKAIKVRKEIIKNHLDFVRRYYYPGYKFYVFKPLFLFKQKIISWIE